MGEHFIVGAALGQFGHAVGRYELVDDQLPHSEPPTAPRAESHPDDAEDDQRHAGRLEDVPGHGDSRKIKEVRSEGDDDSQKVIEDIVGLE